MKSRRLTIVEQIREQLGIMLLIVQDGPQTLGERNFKRFRKAALKVTLLLNKLEHGHLACPLKNECPQKK